MAVRPACDRKPQRHVEDREGDAREEAELHVGEVELLADRLHEDGEDLPVDVAQTVDDEQDEEGEIGSQLVFRGWRQKRCRRIACADHHREHTDGDRLEPTEWCAP